MIEVLKQALEAFEIAAEGGGVNFHAYAEELRQAIKELESQEPVSALWQHGETGRFRVTTPDSITDCDAQWFKVGDLYTHPPQRTWVGLTDEEIASVANNNHPLNGIRSFARAIEAKLKEKNT